MSARDQIIDVVMAHALQADAILTLPPVAWIVMRDAAAWPGAFGAGLVTDTAAPSALPFLPA